MCLLWSTLQRDWTKKMPLKQKQVQNFSNCGPQTTFFASKHLPRPAHCFEFDMPGLDGNVFSKL